MLSDLFEWQKTKVVMKTAAAEWFAVARTAAKPENLQGFHADNLLFILDEASGISDEIYEAITGALTGNNNKILMLGNPTRTTGFFKRAFFEDRELFYTMKVSAAESECVSPEYCERLIRQYGAESDVVRVRVYGEFPSGESDCLIPLELVEAAMMREPTCAGDLIFGADIARQGSDYTVLATRLGDDLIKMDKWKSSDLMPTVGRIMREIAAQMKKHNKNRAEIRVDDDGIGSGVTDRLREVLREKRLNVKVIPCHNGGKPRDSRFGNFVTESYFALRERLVNEEISLVRDEQLLAELTTRKFSLNSKDQIILEKKDDFKKRIHRSPDVADATALAFAPIIRNVGMPVFTLKQSYWRSR